MNAAGGSILRRWDTRDLLRFALLAAVLGAVVLEITPLIFRSDTILFLSITLFGLCVGWILGRTPIPAWAAGGTSAMLGMEFLFVVIGRLDIPLRNWFGSTTLGIARLLPQFWDRGFNLGSWTVDTYQIVQGPISVVLRFQEWAVSIARGTDFFDPVASALFWSLLFFLISAFAGWTLSARGKPFAAVLPALLLFGAVFAYVLGDWHPAILIMALVFLLVVMVEQSQKEQEWDRKKIGYSTSIHWDLFFASAPILAGLLIGSYLIPSISLDEISRWMREQSELAPAPGYAVGQSLGLNSTGIPDSNRSVVEIFPRSHSLGAGPDLRDDVALVIVTHESLKYIPQTGTLAAPHHYWKSQTYDRYSGTGWLTSPTEDRDFEAGVPLFEILPMGSLLHQSVTVSRSGSGPLYVAGELVQVNLAFQVIQRNNGDLLGIIIPGPEYEADSVIVNADESTLREAGTEYPDWIRVRYLQLPRSFPQRVLGLARDLTATQRTPYDSALAIQSYLRKEMHYSIGIGSPPGGRDVVDYFLFDTKLGFCDYYATAMVVLARSAGIPARIAFGYASGTFDPTEGKFTVLESDAHAWPELYFPGVGWVEFEPTSVLAEIRRSATPPSLVSGPIQLPRTNDWFEGFLNLSKVILERSAIPGLIALIGIPILVLLWGMLAPLRLRAIAPAGLMQAVYRDLLAHGRRFGIRISASTTPAEFLQRMEQHQPTDQVLLARMVEYYSRQVFGGRIPTPPQRKEVIGTWPRLNRSLWMAWWKNRLRKLSNRIGGRARRNQNAEQR